jgi:hypothetical protein
MQVEDFLNVVGECDVLRDDIDDIRTRVQLTRGEGSQLDKALTHVDKAKSILSELLPGIKSLDEETREELQNELGEAV